jgi:uncharacterized membrane protein YeaQ/YmgE (transglycosylase-associated protein family)
MRLGDRPLGFIINFLLGIAWASVLIGATTSFFSFYSDSLFSAVISAFIGALPGMVAVLLLEYIITSKEKHEELKKQTKLLEQLLEQHK